MEFPRTVLNGVKVAEMQSPRQSARGCKAAAAGGVVLEEAQHVGGVDDGCASGVDVFHGILPVDVSSMLDAIDLDQV